MEKREPILMIVTGQKGVGKTYTTIQMIAQYIRDNPQTEKAGRKVLILDSNMEYAQFQAIAVKDVKKFSLQKKIEVRRVLPLLVDGRKAGSMELMGIMSDILESFAGGLLILEDINKYLIGTQTQDIVSTLTSNRHVDLDIIIHLQSLAAVTTRMWQNASVIRFHRQQDEIDRYKQRIPYFELLKIAEILVEKQYFEHNDKRFYCYVSGEESYIKGDFSNVDFREACVEYIQFYPKKLNRIKASFKGEKDAREKAINKLANDLEFKFNGNKR